jgi:hypothetical protein
MLMPTPFENTRQLFKFVPKANDNQYTYVSKFNLMPSNVEQCFLDNNMASLKLYTHAVQFISTYSFP